MESGLDISPCGFTWNKQDFAGATHIAELAPAYTLNELDFEVFLVPPLTIDMRKLPFEVRRKERIDGWPQISFFSWLVPEQS
jgi:hypothetical protein